MRSEFERDVDRVKYNYYYRRLADVTQVSSGQGKILRHNRLTHSEKVAQVGRRLVQYLEADQQNKAGIEAAGGIDRNVVTAAGLLHDIGHPPFGHVGEQQLDKLARAHRLDDGYEGNAQTLRIILSLTAHQREGVGLVYGLDLTRAVIAACVKYPYSRQESPSGKKWGYYLPEDKTFHDFVSPLLKGNSANPKPTLEAQIMDWADDITYAVHDLQDWYTDDIVPLHHLRHKSRDDSYVPVDNDEFSAFWQYAAEKMRKYKGITTFDEARRAFGSYASKFPVGRYGGTRKEIAGNGALASKIITEASKKTTVDEEGNLCIDRSMRSVVYALSLVTWYYVIDHPDLVSVQIGQCAKVEEMYVRLYHRVAFCFKQQEDGGDLTEEEQSILRRRLPVQLREFTVQLLAANNGRGAYGEREQCYARAVADYIASMTEDEFEQMWERMCPGERYSGRDSRFDRGDFYRGDEGI